MGLSRSPPRSVGAQNAIGLGQGVGDEFEAGATEGPCVPVADPGHL